MASLIHVDVLVRDMGAALAFYMHFGCTIADDTVLRGPVPAFYSRGRADSMRLVLLDLPGARAFASRIELIELRLPSGEPWPPSAASETSSLRNFSIAVPDLEEALARFAEVGVAAASEVMAVDLPRLGKCRIAFVRDADGNLVELVDAKPALRI